MVRQSLSPLRAASGRWPGRVRVRACAHACGRRGVCLLKIRAAQWKDVITQARAAGTGQPGRAEAGAQACPWGQAKARCQSRGVWPGPVSQEPGRGDRTLKVNLEWLWLPREEVASQPSGDGHGEGGRAWEVPRGRRSR
jgi:hypothetical protein